MLSLVSLLSQRRLAALTPSPTCAFSLPGGIWMEVPQARWETEVPQIPHKGCTSFMFLERADRLVTIINHSFRDVKLYGCLGLEFTEGSPPILSSLMFQKHLQKVLKQRQVCILTLYHPCMGCLLMWKRSTRTVLGSHPTTWRGCASDHGEALERAIVTPPT